VAWRPETVQQHAFTIKHLNRIEKCIDEVNISVAIHRNALGPRKIPGSIPCLTKGRDNASVFLQDLQPEVQSIDHISETGTVDPQKIGEIEFPQFLSSMSNCSLYMTGTVQDSDPVRKRLNNPDFIRDR